jgi:hypothetical protein
LPRFREVRLGSHSSNSPVFRTLPVSAFWKRIGEKLEWTERDSVAAHCRKRNMVADISIPLA